LCAPTYSCEELEENDFVEGDYASNDSRSLEDFGWPEECLHNVGNLREKKHMNERKRKKRGYEFCNGRWACMGGNRCFLTSTDS
jgi:hypothetical protein